jgi:hypothetical protein
MLGLTKLFTALTALAQSAQDLAATVAEANGALRHRLYLDTPAETAALPPPSAQAGPGAAKEAHLHLRLGWALGRKE